MATPSVPSTIISMETLPRIAPGANSRVQSVLACVPFVGSAPEAFSRTHPVSSLPSIGHITLFGPSCALTVGEDKIGPNDANTMISTRLTAFALELAGPMALLDSVMVSYPNSMVYQANALMFFKNVDSISPRALNCVINKPSIDILSHKGQTPSRIEG